MTLREKVEKLLTVEALPAPERKVLVYIVTTCPDGPLEDKVHPAPQAHIEGRYEWFFRADGALRRAA